MTKYQYWPIGLFYPQLGGFSASYLVPQVPVHWPNSPISKRTSISPQPRIKHLLRSTSTNIYVRRRTEYTYGGQSIPTENRVYILRVQSIHTTEDNLPSALCAHTISSVKYFVS